MTSAPMSGESAHHASRLSACLCRTHRWSERWGRCLPCLQRAISGVMLAALPITLLWPYWHPMLPGGVAQHLVSAIYEFSSDEMPRCEQFVRHTEASDIIRSVACETSPAQMMV